MSNGWSVSLTKSNHIKFTDNNGHIVITASTPSDWRSLTYLRVWLKKSGLKF